MSELNRILMKSKQEVQKQKKAHLICSQSQESTAELCSIQEKLKIMFYLEQAVFLILFEIDAVVKISRAFCIVACMIFSIFSSNYLVGCQYDDFHPPITIISIKKCVHSRSTSNFAITAVLHNMYYILRGNSSGFQGFCQMEIFLYIFNHYQSKSELFIFFSRKGFILFFNTIKALAKDFC